MRRRFGSRGKRAVQWSTAVGVSALIIGLGSSHALAAAAWTESGDAGDLPGVAQNAAGPPSATLESITGTISPGNDADMFRICLTGAGTFSATTVGGATFDTQLYLFDETGMGVYGHDDTPGQNLQATLPAGHALTPSTAGVYYLAISQFDNDPVSTGGLIFPSFPFSPVYGPTGPGGNAAVTGWTTNTSLQGGGAYTITLTGAVFCPILPTSAHQCKKGGWQDFEGVFRNQGDCVSYVATGGKNRPAGTR